MCLQFSSILKFFVVYGFNYFVNYLCDRKQIMAPPPQRRNATHSRPSAPTPMSERQQMALLMQMTSSTTEAGMDILYIF